MQIELVALTTLFGSSLVLGTVYIKFLRDQLARNETIVRHKDKMIQDLIADNAKLRTEKMVQAMKIAEENRAYRARESVLTERQVDIARPSKTMQSTPVRNDDTSTFTHVPYVNSSYDTGGYGSSCDSGSSSCCSSDSSC